MAQSESQGLKVALIIFIMLTVTLSITTILFFQSAEDADLRSKKDAATATEANTKATQLTEETKELRRIIGVPDDIAANPLTKVQETFLGDMKTYAAHFPEAQKSYSEALANLIVSLREANEERKKERQDLVDLGARVDKMAVDNEGLLAAAKAEVVAAGVQLATQTSNFAEQDTGHVNKEKALADDIKKVKDEIVAAEAAAKAETDKLKIELAKADLQRRESADQIRTLNRETFEVADGEVRWLNQATGTVWINLGRADSLPRQTKFSVWGRDANEVARATSKGKIEVTQVLSDHLAEARIVEDIPSDPIVPGDKIFTPLWDPGREKHFALIGTLDLDKDGISDHKMVRDLILSSGGVIDAELAEDGKVIGALSVDTRYIILGKPPQDKDRNEKYSTMIKEAQTLGVEQLTIDKFLDHVGFKDPSRLVELGSGADPKDFSDVRPGGPRAAAGATSNLFKKRDPRDKQRTKPAAEKAGEVKPGESAVDEF